MKKGFTLVELMVAITIIGILAILILPDFIKNFTNARDTAMITQEHEIVDASKLFIEDFCRHPLEENEGLCNTYSLQTSDTNKKYTCLKVLQGTKYIDEIVQQGQLCTGFVIYTKDFKSYKSYIKCGAGYQTNGIDSMKDSSGSKIIDKCI